jgi:hypothetical protein
VTKKVDSKPAKKDAWKAASKKILADYEDDFEPIVSKVKRPGNQKKVDWIGTKSIRILKPKVFKAMVYYQMMNVLLKAWRSVWLKFGSVIQAQFTQGRSAKEFQALELARHFINRFHSCRRIMDSRKWEKVEQVLLVKSVIKKPEQIPSQADPLKLVARKLGDPFIPYVCMTTDLHFILRHRQKVKQLEQEQEKPRTFAITPEDMQKLSAFRQKFVQGMIKMGLYKTEDLNTLLEDLLLMQGDFYDPEDPDTLDIVARQRFPRQFIRNRIKKEFQLRSE